MLVIFSLAEEHPVLFFDVLNLFPTLSFFVLSPVSSPGGTEDRDDPPIDYL